MADECQHGRKTGVGCKFCEGVAEPTMTRVYYAVQIRLEAATYRGEPWFTAVGMVAEHFDEIAHGRTPERATAFLLDKFSEHLKAGHIELATPSNYGITVEIVDMSCGVKR